MLLKISSSGQKNKNKCDAIISFIELQNVGVLELGILSTLFVFFRQINGVTYLHHVPLFKLIKQFQPFNPNPQNSTQVRIFPRIFQRKMISFPI